MMGAEHCPRRRRGARRDAFTLVEVMVALTLGAAAVLAARMLLESLAAGAVRIERAAEADNRNANGERLLRSLVGQIEVGYQQSTFSGDETSARFSTWCQSASGWLERCRVSLAIELEDNLPSLVATLGDRERVVLRRARSSLGLRYLVDVRDGGTWFVKWGDGFLTPRAIGVVADADTVVVRIGERGQ